MEDEVYWDSFYSPRPKFSSLYTRRPRESNFQMPSSNQMFPPLPAATSFPNHNDNRNFHLQHDRALDAGIPGNSASNGNMSGGFQQSLLDTPQPGCSNQVPFENTQRMHDVNDDSNKKSFQLSNLDLSKISERDLSIVKQLLQPAMIKNDANQHSDFSQRDSYDGAIPKRRRMNQNPNEYSMDMSSSQQQQQYESYDEFTDPDYFPRNNMSINRNFSRDNFETNYNFNNSMSAENDRYRNPQIRYNMTSSRPNPMDRRKWHEEHFADSYTPTYEHYKVHQAEYGRSKSKVKNTQPSQGNPSNKPATTAQVLKSNAPPQGRQMEKCYFCDVTFESAAHGVEHENSKRHLEKILSLNKIDKYNCVTCDVTMNTVEQLKIHTTKQRNMSHENSKLFCRGCKVITFSIKSYVTHLCGQVHFANICMLKDDPSVYECGCCEVTKPDFQQFQIHIKGLAHEKRFRQYQETRPDLGGKKGDDHLLKMELQNKLKISELQVIKNVEGTNYYCKFCNLYLNSFSPAMQHTEGWKHKFRVLSNGTPYERGDDDESKLVNDMNVSNPEDNSTEQDETLIKPYYCSACHIATHQFKSAVMHCHNFKHRYLTLAGGGNPYEFTSKQISAEELEQKRLERNSVEDHAFNCRICEVGNMRGLASIEGHIFGAKHRTLFNRIRNEIMHLTNSKEKDANLLSKTNDTAVVSMKSKSKVDGKDSREIGNPRFCQLCYDMKDPKDGKHAENTKHKLRLKMLTFNNADGQKMKFKCDICKIPPNSINGVSSLTAHLIGARHRKNSSLADLEV